MTSLLARGDRRDTPSRPGSDRTRALLSVALRPTGVAVALICVAVVATLVSSNSDLTGAAGAAAASWLALHQVSLSIADAPLGILPLLPTALLVWAVWRGCARAVTRETDLREASWVVGAAVAGPLAATLVALAVISDASAVTALESPNALLALALVGGVHLGASCAGVASVVGRSECVRLGVPDWVPEAVRPAARAAGLLLAAGAAATVASLVWSWSEVGALMDGDFGIVGVFGQTVLSVLYLPNVAVGAAAVIVGGTAQVGGTSLSLFEVVPGAVPPVPVLGGTPAEMVGSAWPVLLVVPVVVGALLGRDCGRSRLPMQETAYMVASAAAGVGVLAALVGFLAGGDIGSFGYVGVVPGVLGLITFAWLVVPGLLVGALVARRNRIGSDGRWTGSTEGATATKDGAPADGDDPVFEVKRLERPTMRFRAAGEQEPAQAGTKSEPADTETPETTAETTSQSPPETAAETEVVDETATPPSVDDDLPDGPASRGD
ncbi:cell division protein PerM [Rhodococcus spongiicola]|uniref:Uncharacterized protein n=1 Tax=Rhodococcus spongiicola TaxID=2487352 RepID=A0A438B5V7_9NOCA|nr:DUF6350 family protein [Rhodococcus spongiicola]RVW06336.1 hypothetical protein EF834_02555 [Rhodococcus spongiicola]